MPLVNGKPCMTMGEISNVLGVSINKKLMKDINIKPYVEIEGGASYWLDTDIAKIAREVAKHLSKIHLTKKEP